jgi:hypothetical protein
VSGRLLLINQTPHNNNQEMEQAEPVPQVPQQMAQQMDQQVRRVRVYFIRHAQSEENVRLDELAQTLRAVRSYRIADVLQELPTALTNAWQIIANLHASKAEEKLSAFGERQLQELKIMLKEAKFWHLNSTTATEESEDIVLCSPFYRARRTCEVLCPNVKSLVGNHFNDQRNDVRIQNVEYLDCLAENSMLDDLLTSSSSTQRVTSFERALSDRLLRRTQTSLGGDMKVVVIGHCQFFRRLLKSDFYFRNADVWSANLCVELDEPRPTGQCLWTDVKLEHRGFLSLAHPFRDSHTQDSGHGLTQSQTDTAEARRGSPIEKISVIDAVDGDSGNSEPTCRFCLMTYSEDPSSPLIRPCLCTGTNAYIHVKCLQTWRQTSQQANNFCNVCLYRYRIKRAKWAERLCTRRSVWVVTLCLLIGLLICSGILVNYVSRLPLLKELLESRLGIDSVLYGVLQALDVNAVCDPYNYEQLKRIVDVSWVANTQPHLGAYGRAYGGFTLLKQFYHLWPYFFRYGLLCEPTAELIVSVVVCGLACVSCAGACLYGYSHIYTRMIVNGDQQERIYLVSMIVTIYNFGSRAVRFVTALGCTFAIREVFLKMEMYTKFLAQYVESIQEPGGEM